MKRLLVILIIIVIIGVPLYLVFNNQQSQDNFYENINAFDLLLREQNYEQAKAVYEQASNTFKANYNISLEAYAEELVQQAKRKDTTQDSLDLLYSYNQIGYSSETLNTAILHYENLLQSNYIFVQGVEYFSNKEYENAIECFNDVLDYDENYNEAQRYLNDYHEYNLAWEQAADNNAYGRNPQPNSIANQSNYVYLPYKQDGTNAIYKINLSTYSVLSFPIASNDYGAKISNLNIVGEYIFFLVEYNTAINEDGMKAAVYRISTEGTDLIKVADCDYSYLITYKDNFYAISASKGIVMVDKYFVDEQSLVDTDQEIKAMQMAEEGIYYTAYDEEEDITIQYFYDGENTEELLKEINLHYYHYDDYNIIYYDSNTFFEYLYQEKSTNIQLYAGDIYKYYGMLNESIILTSLGDYQQECIRVKNFDTYSFSFRASTSKISYVPIGICYEEGIILLESDAGISITTEDMRIQNTFQLSHINDSILVGNKDKLDINVNLYSENENTQNLENTWIYSDQSTHIETQKVYLDQIESIAYITHIYTTDFNWLKTEQIEKGQMPQEAVSGIAWAMSAQAYNEEPNYVDEDRGILNEDVYVYNDDGLFFGYRQANNVPAEKAISNNILFVFTEGRIILDNHKITSDSTRYINQDGRSAIGIVEAGHYIAVTVPNAQKELKGLSQYALAQLMQDEGCISAFSFDYGYGPYVMMSNEFILEIDEDDMVLPSYSEMLYYTLD